MTEKDLIIQDLRRENAELRARVPQWISVEDRLPEEDGKYLATSIYFGGDPCIDTLSFAKNGETIDEYEFAGQKNIWYFYDFGYGDVSTEYVTHWMPLPQPPKGE